MKLYVLHGTRWSQWQLKQWHYNNVTLGLPFPGDPEALRVRMGYSGNCTNPERWSCLCSFALYRPLLARGIILSWVGKLRHRSVVFFRSIHLVDYMYSFANCYLPGLSTNGLGIISLIYFPVGLLLQLLSCVFSIAIVAFVWLDLWVSAHVFTLLLSFLSRY